MPKCKSCGAEIIWVKTRGGTAMPIDPGGTVGEYFDHKTMTSHFATCPESGKWRKKQVKKVG